MSTHATKHDTAKPRFSLLPHGPLAEVVKVYEFGAGKYGTYNWQAGLPYTRWYDAVMRHLFAWFRGERHDPESGLHHLAHATFGLLALMWQEDNNKGEDDRR